VLAGDFNVMQTDLDVYAPERWVDDALFRPEVREAYRHLVPQDWTDALRAIHPGALGEALDGGNPAGLKRGPQISVIVCVNSTKLSCGRRLSVPP
jgi:hypothetical protein